MNNKPNDIDELNKKIEELTRRLDEKIAEETNHSTNGDKFTYDEYRTQVVKDDINKLIEFNSTMKWVWFIPIIGVFKYFYDLTIAISGLDRGVVRQELGRAPFSNPLNVLLFIVVVLFVYITFWILFTNFYPWIQKRFNNTAIENSLKRLDSNDL